MMSNNWLESLMIQKLTQSMWVVSHNSSSPGHRSTGSTPLVADVVLWPFIRLSFIFQYKNTISELSVLHLPVFQVSNWFLSILSSRNRFAWTSCHHRADTGWSLHHSRSSEAATTAITRRNHFHKSNTAVMKQNYRALFCHCEGNSDNEWVRYSLCFSASSLCLSVNVIPSFRESGPGDCKKGCSAYYAIVTGFSFCLLPSPEKGSLGKAFILVTHDTNG